MRAKKLTMLIVFFALMGIGIWWVMQPAEVAPVKVAPPPVPAKAVAQPIAAVEMPKVAPVAPSSSPPVTIDAEKAPDTPQLYVPHGGVTDLGIVQFTEGMPITVFTNKGVKWTLTANYFPTKGQPSDKITIDILPEDPATGQPSTRPGAGETLLVPIGEEHKLRAGDAQLKLTPVMKTN